MLMSLLPPGSQRILFHFGSVEDLGQEDSRYDKNRDVSETKYKQTGSMIIGILYSDTGLQCQSSNHSHRA